MRGLNSLCFPVVRFELTLFSGGGVGLAVGPADRKDELHRHVADSAGDRRRSFACDAVLAELVGGELAGSRIVAYLIGADDELSLIHI